MSAEARQPILLEVCVDSLDSAVAAQRGGADRVELCANLLEGGTTPSAGMIARVRESVSIGLQIMIRPRGGDFYYSPEELEMMERDILTAKELGADGVVLGILRVDGSVDQDRTRHLVEMARPLSVTFHRALDMTRDRVQALRDVVDAGADRVLTSGGEPTAEQGLRAIAELAEAASGRISVIAGGGIRTHNVKQIVEQTRVPEIHVGIKSSVPSPMQYINPRISMGALEGREYQRSVVLEEMVRAVKAALAISSKVR